MDVSIISSSTLLAIISIPCLVTVISVWLLQRKVEKREKAREAQDKAREQSSLFLVQGVTAAIALGEATAEAVQRLDKDCNGKMQKALDYALTVKHEQRHFLNKQGIKNLL